MSFPEWDCEQEQKDKYAAHVRKCAEEIMACNIAIAWSKRLGIPQVIFANKQTKNILYLVFRILPKASQ